MQVGDLIKLNLLHDVGLRGVILNIYPNPVGERGENLLSVLWTDGDRTEEFPIDVEVVPCK